MVSRLRRAFLSTVTASILLATPLAGAARDLSSPAHRADPSDQLVVRARAGLHPALRHQLLEQHGTQEIADIEALEAFVVRVPHARVNAVVKSLRQSGYFKSVERDAIATIAEIPNDPQFASEWGLLKINAPAAWNTTTGSAAVTVAIVDSGIDPNHPDLRNQLVTGYDFVNDDADPSDDHGHGTRMAGVVAADGYNGIGIIGVAPDCKLMPVKVLGADGNGAYSTIANGITYAANHGARIINLSLGGTASSPLLESAVDYAAAHGAIVIASAGNYGTGDPVYPAAYANAIAVGATDQSDVIADFSSYGSSLAFAAPGVNIVTTNRTGGRNALYVGSSGTSPAAAFVAGAFALLLSARPDLSNSDAVSLMTSAARDLGSRGWDPHYGWGRVDIAGAVAVNAVRSPIPIPVSTPAPVVIPIRDRRGPAVSIAAPLNNANLSGSIIVDVTASDDVGVTTVELSVDNQIVASDSSSPFSFVWDATTVRSGKHVLNARAYDAAGHQQLSKSVRVTVTQATAASTHPHR